MGPLVRLLSSHVRPASRCQRWHSPPGWTDRELGRSASGNESHTRRGAPPPSSQRKRGWGRVSQGAGLASSAERCDVGPGGGEGVGSGPGALDAQRDLGGVGDEAPADDRCPLGPARRDESRVELGDPSATTASLARPVIENPTFRSRSPVTKPLTAPAESARTSTDRATMSEASPQPWPRRTPSGSCAMARSTMSS